MPETDLATIYRGDIDCLNTQELDRLGQFVRDCVIHNDRALGRAGYQDMLEQNVRAIPICAST